MDCPRCKTPTEERDLEHVRVDVCPRCEGMFLERGELNRLAPTDGDLELASVEHDDHLHPDIRPPVRCPRCIDPLMQKVDLARETDVVLEHCERCGGFWLDGRELDRVRAVVRRMNEAAEEVADPFYLQIARLVAILPK